MDEREGGFLIRFDEEQRADLLKERERLERGFSDALSSADWKLHSWEVCGLLFKPDEITHWALAKRRKMVATSKVRVDFSHVVEADIDLLSMERKLGGGLHRHLARSRSGVGGRVPPATWAAMKDVLRTEAPDSLEIVVSLERLRDLRRSQISGPDAETLAQQRDATGLALNIFDSTGTLRRTTLRGWEAPATGGPVSFLGGLGDISLSEDQILAHDYSVFPGSDPPVHFPGSVLFTVGDRQLEVFNVNRTPLETALGVDLIYFNSEFQSWTLVQYKVMRQESRGTRQVSVYRPDPNFNRQLETMRLFRAETPDLWEPNEGETTYRLCGDGFYFKFCSRLQLASCVEELAPGMYVPRRFAEALLAGEQSTGPRRGKLIDYEIARRHLSNTLFSSLVRDGWIGTRGLSSKHIAAILRSLLAEQHSVVVARERQPGESANLDQTRAELRF